MPQNNLLFVSENLTHESHTTETLEVLSSRYNIVGKIDLSNFYLQHGFDGCFSEISKLIIKNKVNFLILAVGASRLIDPEKLENWRQLIPDIIICCAFSDSEVLFTRNDFYYAQHADFCWVYNPAMTSVFEMYDLPVVAGQLFDYKLYRKKRTNNKDLNISFIGGMVRSNRSLFIDIVQKNLPDFFVAGYGTKKGIITRDQKNSVIARSFLHLSFSGVHDNDYERNKRLRGFKGRHIEVLLVGSLPLCQWDPCLLELFGPEVPFFFTPDDLLEIYNKLINDKEKIIQIRKKMLRNYMNKYSNKIILSKIQSFSKQKSFKFTNYLDREFLELFNRQRFYFFGYFIVKLEMKKAVNELIGIKQPIYFFSSLNYLYQILRGIYHGLCIRKFIFK
jgi:hypothetical protein